MTRDADVALPPAGATPATITQQLNTVRATLQAVITDYATVPFTRPEKQRLHDDLVSLRALRNQLQNRTTQ